MDQDKTWHTGRPRPRRHCVRWGPSSPPKKGHSRHFSAHFYCRQTTGWIKMPLGTMVGLDPGNIVLDTDPASPPGGAALEFSVHACCRQTAGWIKMPFGTKVGLGPGHIMLHGELASPKGGFGPCLLWPTGGPSQLLLSTCF